jgi:hypothetical protein
LYVTEGHALSLQYHERKEEKVAVHLRPGTRHRMTAREDTVVLEASTTELDDVVRLEDRYDRP